MFNSYVSLPKGYLWGVQNIQWRITDETMLYEYTRVIPNSGFHPWVKWSRDGKSIPFERTNRLYWTLAYGSFLKSGVPQIIHFN